MIDKYLFSYFIVLLGIVASIIVIENKIRRIKMKDWCSSCIYQKVHSNNNPCFSCFMQKPSHYVLKETGKTNADKIRSMTDFQLMDFIINVHNPEGQFDPQFIVNGKRFKDWRDLLNWLKEETNNE